VSGDRESELFQAVTINLFGAAWAALGKVPNPMTGKIDRDLGIARLTIDTLAALEVRTRGNRTAPEDQLFERVLGDLRLNYLDEVKKGEVAQGESTPEATA
jgi:hypothetical protein